MKLANRLGLLGMVVACFSLNINGYAQTVVITQVNLHSQNDDGYRFDDHSTTSVVVKDGQIVAIGSDVQFPAGAQVLSGKGLVMTPGLFAAYSQLGLDEINLEASTIDSMLDDTGYGPAFDVQYAINDESVVIDVTRVEGVTHAIVAPRVGPDPLAGFGAAISLSSPSTLLQPRVAMFGQVGSNIATKVGGSRAEVIARLRRGLEDLRGFRATRYQAEPKQYSRYDMIALKQTVDNKLPFVITVHRANEIRQVLSLAQQHDLNLVVRGGTEAWKVADELAQAGVAVILDPLNNLPRSFDRLGARNDNATLLVQAGVKIAIVVSDSHNIRLLRQHAGNAVAHGLDWDVALRAITRTPVEIFGLDDSLGKIAVGGPATFVLWQGDPLEVTTWPTQVMLDGEWVDPRSRQVRLFERYRDLSTATQR